jgi:hypothetical protein
MATILRGFAAAEIVVAVFLLVGAVRTPAAVVTSLLGACFVVVGLRAQMIRSTAPCGCFGSSSRRPLGWSNVAVGLALVATYPVNVRLAPGADYQASTALIAVVGSIALCLYVNRHLIVRLARPVSGVPAGSEVH